MNHATAHISPNEALMLERLRAHVADIKARSPWYVGKLDQVEPADIRSREDLARLPFTTKQDLTAHNTAFRCVPPHRIVDHVATSGSTSRPVPFVLSESDLDRLARNEAASMALAGVTTDDVVQMTTTLDKRFMAGLAYWLGLRRIGAGVVRTGPGNVQGQWDSIEQNGVSVLIVVPSFLLRMLQEHHRTKGGPPPAHLRKAICIGEPITAPDGGPNRLAQRILELAPMELHGTYASTEMATALTEAVPFGGHVVPHDLIMVEVLDEAGRPVPEGQVGEVVATPWGVEAMPLLRFRTGDLCSWRSEEQADGSRRQLLGPVLGRLEQRMKVKGTTLFPQQIMDALHAESGIDHFVILRETDDLGSDQVRILVPDTTTDLEGLTTRLRDRLRVAPLLATATIKEIDQLRSAPRNRKPTPFIDRSHTVRIPTKR